MRHHNQTAAEACFPEIDWEALGARILEAAELAAAMHLQLAAEGVDEIALQAQCLSPVDESMN